jgi:hypothetical protein
MWPQIGEYTLDGHRVRVFKAGHAIQYMPWLDDLVVKIALSNPMASEPVAEKLYRIRQRRRALARKQ